MAMLNDVITIINDRAGRWCIQGENGIKEGE